MLQDAWTDRYEPTPVSATKPTRPAATDPAPLDEAMETALSLVRPIADTEMVTVAKARGRTVATAIRAPRAMPFYTGAAMDGFAVDTATLRGDGPWTLPIAGTARPGLAMPCETSPTLLRPVAWTIATGARVPTGANAVVAREGCLEQGSNVVLHERPSPGAHIRPAGSDTPEGALLMASGGVIEPRHQGYLTANGLAHVMVRRRPRVAVVSTGTELIEPGGELRPGQVFDANRAMLLSLAEAAGAVVTDGGSLDDDPFLLREALQHLAARHDLVVTSGSVSVGVTDHVREALEKSGGTVHLWRAAIKPGKPVMMGTLGRAAFMGLPGNPLAAFVTFHLFVEPQIATMRRTPPRRWREGSLACTEPGDAKRARIVPVSLCADDRRGHAVLKPMPESSGSLRNVALADGLACIEAGARGLDPGSSIRWLPFTEECTR